MPQNNKITLKQFYDEFIPYIDIVIAVKKNVENIDKKLDTFHQDNKEYHKTIDKKLDSKITAKAFGAWLGSLSVIIGIILVLIGFIR